MTKWEYRMHALPSSRLTAPINTRYDKDKPITILDDLNSLGSDGWEVVFVWPDGSHVLMKRPKE
jgi:hypothetical protein